MSAENSQTTGEEQENAAEKQERERSTIGFPYMDLDDALKVAKGIHDTSVHSSCTHDQLAAELSLSMNSSGYRMRISTARMFGLIDLDRSGAVKLTSLGSRIVDEGQTKKAKVDAFLNVPLYRALHEELRGKVVPPPAALERVIAALGVSPKQTDRARQAFERSAQSAGFFDKGRDRLVAPSFNGGDGTEADTGKGGSGKGGGDEPPSDRHALIEALVDVLPKPGDPFEIEDLADWLRAAEVNLRIIYKIKGRITINVEHKPA